MNSLQQAALATAIDSMDQANRTQTAQGDFAQIPHVVNIQSGEHGIRDAFVR
jgi:hypothetical protein